MEIEIPDDNNLIMAKINAKIQFIWSIYKYYQDLLTKSEKVLQIYSGSIQKTNKLLENLNEPLKFFEAVDNKGDHIDPVRGINNSNSQNQIIKKLEKNVDHTANTGNNVQENHTKQYEVADKLENFIKTTLSNHF